MTKVYWIEITEKDAKRILSCEFKTWTGEYIKIGNPSNINHDYWVVMTIKANNEQEIIQALDGQISDGIFENIHVIKVIEVDENKSPQDVPPWII